MTKVKSEYELLVDLYNMAAAVTRSSHMKREQKEAGRLCDYCKARIAELAEPDKQDSDEGQGDHS